MVDIFKFIKLFIGFNSFVTVFAAKTDSSLLAIAFQRVVKAFSAVNGDKISIVTFGGDSRSIVSSLKTLELPYQLSANLKGKPEHLKNKVQDSAVLTFESVAKLKTFNSNFKFTNIYPKSFLFLVHCRATNLAELSRMPDTEILQYEYFIVDIGKSIKLFTFSWYTEIKCNVPQLIEVNSFDKKALKWKNSNFVLEKLTNFYGCSFTVRMRSEGRAFEGKNENSFTGYNYKILKDLSSQLNYKLEIIITEYYHTSEASTYSREGKSFDMHVNHGCINRQDLITRTVAYLQPYMWNGHFLAVPPGKEYDNYEKLLLPFDVETWIMLCLTFLAAFTTVFIVSFMKPEVRSVVFGREDSTPFFNIAAILLGNNLANLPKKNFSRFLISTFILFCLVIRTCWQGKIFEFMQKDLRRPQVGSIDEMIEKNLTFYMNTWFTYFFNESELITRYLKEKECSKLFNFFFIAELLFQHTIKAFTMTSCTTRFMIGRPKESYI
jgi:hypothetical protein